jgi:hypothetical protein
MRKAGASPKPVRRAPATLPIVETAKSDPDVRPARFTPSTLRVATRTAIGTIIPRNVIGSAKSRTAATIEPATKPAPRERRRTGARSQLTRSVVAEAPASAAPSAGAPKRSATTPPIP